MSFAQLKREVRRAVHDAFAVDATYQDASMLYPVQLRVRYHSRVANPFGDLEGAGYAEIIENAERVVFDLEELAAKAITPCKGAKITLVEYGFCATLNTRDTKTGPVNEAWTITR
jgi:hypothetical protein